MENVKVVLSDGKEVSLSEWQKIYVIVVGSKMIGTFFSLDEGRFKRDLSEYGELVVNGLLIEVLDQYRRDLGSPVTINSFNRSQAHQDKLKAEGFKAATYSPHVVKMAADIDTPALITPEATKKETERRVTILKGAATKLGVSVRVGYKQYLNAGQSFIHVDVCPEFYAKGKPFHDHFHPKAWENEISW